VGAESAAIDIRDVPLFAHVSVRAQRRLSVAAVARSYDDGQMVVLQGDREAAVFFVIEGRVRVYRTNLDGREQTLIVLCEGDVFNMPSAFIEESRAPASAVADGPAELLSMSRADFRQIACEIPEVACAVLADLSQKLYHLTDLTHALGLLTVRARLAGFLLTHAQQSGVTPVRWTHQEIASRLGTVREVVSRTLRAFVQEALIDIQRHRIVILDLEALKREAES
jgi:CRP/FNR family transcriptional regulator